MGPVEEVERLEAELDLGRFVERRRKVPAPAKFAMFVPGP